jgi:hypothetical protein
MYRVPLIYSAGNPKANDGLIQAAAENGLEIDANLQKGAVLPSGSALTEFKELTERLVRRYGYGGEFWSENPGVPYHPIKTWEIWNEENAEGVPATSYGPFLGEIANTIHGASKEPGQSTEVLFGGLLAVNPAGAPKRSAT